LKLQDYVADYNSSIHAKGFSSRLGETDSLCFRDRTRNGGGKLRLPPPTGKHPPAQFSMPPALTSIFCMTHEKTALDAKMSFPQNRAKQGGTS